jgi:uncharacterized protein (UPF0212 family)
MTSPIEEVRVSCPKCAHVYETFFRASMNLSLDPSFDEAYIEEMSTGTCPECGEKTELGALVVGDDGVWNFREGMNDYEPESRDATPDELEGGDK